MSRIRYIIIVLLMAGSIIMIEPAVKPAAAADKPVPVAVAPEDLPTVVAVLPFQNETKEAGIASQVRRSFYNNFSSKPYRDIEVTVADSKIVQLERESGKSVYDLPPAEICRVLECDGLIYGKITDYQKVYAAVYSQLGVTAEVWMVNTKSGKELFRIKDAVRYHGGSVPMSPIGLIMAAVSSALNLREMQQVRMVNELAYKFNERIPAPEGIVAEDRPVIREVLTNVKEGPFGRGKMIRVGLEGEKGLVAAFDIGNFKKSVLMKETKPGLYLGEYLVMPGDNAEAMPVIAYLKRPGGFESQWIDVTGTASIDTTPPPQVTGLRTKGFTDRIEVTWEGLRNVPDLAGYRVLRSLQPLSGFAELAKTEQPFCVDKTAAPEKPYFYRVVAYDATGNESAVVDAVRSTLMAKEPVILSGTLDKDTVLDGVYRVKETLIVPQGLTLSLAPATRVTFDAGAALLVKGRLEAAAREDPVEFLPAGDDRWQGVKVQGGRIVLNGFRIKAAVAALHLESSEGTVENGVITGSDTGLLIAGAPAVTMQTSTLSGNKVAVELQKTNAALRACNIFQNDRGVVLKGFSGILADNNIIDNGENIWSEAPVKIGANYLGSLRAEEIKTKDVLIAKVYNARYPGGQVVDAVVDPFSSLSPAERTAKATEFMIEAGNYFRQRNYGKASILFASAVQATPTAEAYYYLALCYQQMKEDDKAVQRLEEGAKKFANDTTLIKALGFMYYQKGNEAEAKKAFAEVIRLSPGDRQVKFLLERMGQ